MKKILLIDDDESLRDTIAEVLTLCEFIPITAADGKSGIEKALIERPDLILCDVMMPGIDGYGVLNILSRHPLTKLTPFVFLSGKKESDDLRKGMGMGADDYLVKPFQEIELLQTIDLRLKKSDDLRRSFSSDLNTTEEMPKSATPEGTIKFKNRNKEPYRFKKRHILYTAGQVPSNVYYVVSGKLKEYRFNQEGKELITNIYGAGDFLGYRQVFEQILYTENAQVIEEAELILIPKAEFLELLNHDTQTAKQFIEILSHNLTVKEEKLIKMAYDPLRKRIANGIIEVAEKFSNKRRGYASIEISREDLAHIIGSAQESLIRLLKEFKSEKLIDIEDGRIIILDEERLRTFTDSNLKMTDIIIHKNTNHGQPG
ncbi:response regulator [Desertivirga brevis]|uniref:response regulator n=1 Tax=Desertivirga brevis TaxID=2810310 RepID=UPI001A974769|nr:response regulator [Pedobacter sp. SYSU D00873]